MRIPSYEPTPGQLVAFVNANTVARKPIGLYEITLFDGSVLRWAAHPADVVVGPRTFLAHGSGGRPLIRRGDLDCERGLRISDLTVTLLCGDSAMLGARKLTLAATLGAFRRARLRYEAAVLNLAGVLQGAVCLWEGKIEARPSSNEVELTVESDLAMLNQRAPQRLIQPACPFDLFDANCGVSKAAFTFAATASGGTTTTIATTDAAIVAKAAGWFEQGVLAIGGLERTVRKHTKSGATATLTVFPPLPSAASGSFSIVLGCPKTIEVCDSRFSNRPRCGAMPAVPREENAR